MGFGMMRVHLPIHVLTTHPLHLLLHLLSEQLHLQVQERLLVAGAELASLEAHLHLQIVKLPQQLKQ